MLVIIIIPTGCCIAKQARLNITLLCPVFRAGGGFFWMLKRSLRHALYTVDSRYLEIEGTIINTSRYPYCDISDL